MIAIIRGNRPFNVWCFLQMTFELCLFWLLGRDTVTYWMLAYSLRLYVVCGFFAFLCLAMAISRIDLCGGPWIVRSRPCK